MGKYASMTSWKGNNDVKEAKGFKLFFKIGVLKKFLVKTAVLESLFIKLWAFRIRFRNWDDVFVKYWEIFENSFFVEISGDCFC